MICCSLHWVIKALLILGVCKIDFLPSHQLGELHLRGVLAVQKAAVKGSGCIA